MSQEVLKDMVNIIGKMDLTIEDNFCQEWGMEEDSGKWSMEIHIKDSTWTTRKMERGFIFGKMDPDTKETFRMITDMDMVRWSGKMEEHTKENGWMGSKKIY